MGKRNETILTCSCATDIIGEESNSGIFVQFLKAVLHLQGSPHDMALPVHKRSVGDNEIFTDIFDQNHKVILNRKKG